MDKFSDRLKKIRRQRGISQQALGDLCELSKNMIGRYERGKRIPNIYTAKKIANALGVTMDYLCGD